MPRFKRWLHTVPVAAVLLGLLIGAQPVLADTELGHTGTIGFHSIFDSVQCDYGWVSQHNIANLKWMYVGPPKMKAVAGNNSQTVGWRAIVQRRWGNNGSNPAWSITFTSAERTAVTNATTNAPFSQYAEIHVTLPFGASNYQTKFAQYRVLVKMFWHNANGSIQGTATHRVDHYTRTLGYETKPRQGNCLGYDPAL